jgi:HlyD family secretion protein
MAHRVAQNTTKQLLAIILFLILALLLTACSEQASEVTVEESELAADTFGNIVSASGRVVPVRWAALSFEAGGRLTELVEEGSQVSAGDVLARLETNDLVNAVEQARAALATAEAQLALARADVKAESVTAAEGAVVVAEGNVAAAEGALAQIEEGTTFAIATAEAALAQAQGTLDTANAELSRANAELSRLFAGPRPEEIAVYQGRLAQAQGEYMYVEDIHLELIDNEIGGRPEERTRYQSESARGARDAAQAQLDLANAGTAAGAIAVGRAGVSVAQAQVTVAEAGVIAAEVALNDAKANAADITVAEAQVQIAQGQLIQAEAQRDGLITGALVEEIAVLEAQVAQAQVTLAQAEESLAKATLLAPFDGTIGIVHLKAGESVLPGAPVLVLGDTSELRVETTDLNEVDAIQVGVGSSVTLTFDALPAGTTEGEIVRLAPMASAGQGGTNFTAMIEMTSPPEALRWGMTAFVDIEVD